MNERIQELANQAGFWEVLVPAMTKENDKIEKFAELIIQKCIDIIGAGGEFVSRPKLVEKLQEHFGVE